MPEFRMPSLGADMDAGTVVEWLVHPGDHVRRGDIVAVVDTSKSAIDVECFSSGVIRELLVEPGAEVPVGTPLAIIDVEDADSAAPSAAPAAPAAVPAATGAAPTATVPAPPAPGVPAGAGAHGLVTSPLVRHLAESRGLDPATLTGTGPGGRVTRDDVLHSGARTAATAGAAPTAATAGATPTAATAGATPAAAPEPAPTDPREVRGLPEIGRIAASPYARRLAAARGVDLHTLTGSGFRGAIRARDLPAVVHRPPAPTADAGTATAATATGTAPTLTTATTATASADDAARRRASMRQAVAALMARSKREVPHYYLSATIDLGPATRWLHRCNRELPVSGRLVPAALLLKACALAARKVPELNGFWLDGGFVPGAGVHLGVAVALRGGGLIAPAIHDVDTLAVGELMAALRDLVGRARAGRLRGSEMTDATLTVTNLGDQGVDSVFGVIYPPQVALVGFGKVADRPWAVDGLLGVRPVVTATLAGDHRATDGATGARFLSVVADLLSRPEEL